ncbi:MAG: M16 family metallopeptidase, partial [bacterium]
MLSAQVPDVATSEFKLDNGLKVVLRPDKSVPRVNVVMAYHVGSRNERPGRTGFAHFFEHMMFRGTKNVPNYDKPLQEAGSSSNAFTTEDMTVYFETVPSNFLERALYLEADRLAWLPTALDQQKFDTEREVVKNERRQSYENVPYGLAEETILANLYPAGHPYRWSVIGSMADLSRASLDDLKQFFAEFYHPANATLCLVGDFDIATAEKLIRRYFSPIPAGPQPKKAAVPAVPQKTKALELVDKVSVPRVYWVWPAVNENAADAPALELLGQILSAGDASRLHERLVIRDQSATSVKLGFTGSEVDGYIQMEATIAPGHSVDEVEKAVAEELEKMWGAAPSQRELDRMKAQYELAAFSPLEEPQSLAFALAIGLAQYGDSKQFRKDIERVLGVTADQVHAAAKKYLTTDKLKLVVRPAKEGEEKSQAVTGVGPLPGGEAEIKREFRGPAASDIDWSAMPGPTDRPNYNPPGYEIRKLKNGMELWFARRETPLVHLEMVMEGGTIDDPAGKDGVGQLTGMLIDKGTKTKTNRELTEAFELLGSTPGVSVGPDQAGISLTLLPRNIKPALDLVNEMLTEPRFEQAEFDRQKTQMIAALKRGPDSPGYLAARAYSKLIYGNQSRFGHPADGTLESISELTLDDTRRFFDFLTNPARTKIFIVGDMTMSEAANLAHSTLGEWQTKAAVAEAKSDRPAETTSAEPGVVYLVDETGAVQSVIRVGRRWNSRTDAATYLPGQVGNYTLGGDFLSRLNQNLRERNGYSYGAGSAFAYIRGGERCAVSTSVRADVTGAALREIFNELDGVAKTGKQPLTGDDLGLAR